VDEKCPLKIGHAYMETGKPQPDTIVELTGITDEILELAARDPSDVLHEFVSDLIYHDVEYLIGHNGIGFDKPMLLASFLKNNPGSQHEKFSKIP